jgi:hypothetical protein
MTKELKKQAGSEFLGSLAELGVGTMTSLALLSLAGLGFAGYTAGWVGAHMTAKGKNDLDNVRNEYLDARLSADVAENEQKLKNEYKARQQAVAPKSTRLFG